MLLKCSNRHPENKINNKQTNEFRGGLRGRGSQEPLPRGEGITQGVKFLEQSFSEKASHGCECLHPQGLLGGCELNSPPMGPWDIYCDRYGERARQLAKVWIGRSSKRSDMTGITRDSGTCKPASFYSVSHSTNVVFYKKERARLCFIE